MNQFRNLLLTFRTQYLENRHIGIRQFAAMTKIRRTRLERLFAGQVEPTAHDITQINAAMVDIEVHYKRRHKTPFSIPIDSPTHPTLP